MGGREASKFQPHATQGLWTSISCFPARSNTMSMYLRMHVEARQGIGCSDAYRDTVKLCRRRGGVGGTAPSSGSSLERKAAKALRRRRTFGSAAGGMESSQSPSKTLGVASTLGSDELERRAPAPAARRGGVDTGVMRGDAASTLLVASMTHESCVRRVYALMARTISGVESRRLLLPPPAGRHASSHRASSGGRAAVSVAR